MEWELIFCQVTHFNFQSTLIFWMFLHFFSNEGDRFSRDIEPIVIETGIFPQQRKESITNSTAQFNKLALPASFLMQLFEDGDRFDFPFQVGTIFKKTTLVEPIKFIPHFLGFAFCFLIHLFCFNNLILLQLGSGLLLHLFGQLVEDNLLLGAPKLVEICLVFWDGGFLLLHCKL